MNIQRFPATVTNIYMNSFEWPCKQVMNAIHGLFYWLHVFDHVKSVSSFHPIECSLNGLKCTNKKSRF